MAERLQCEFALVRYVADPVRGEFANIGVLLRSPAETMVRFTRDWSRVRCMDPDVDTALLEALESEWSERLRRGAEEQGQTRPLLEALQDSLSNCVQLTEMKASLAKSLAAEIEQLLRLYVEPLRAAGPRRVVRGRTAIAGKMRDAFTQAGVWELMRKRIAASEYTRRGDPLRLDCGYRNGSVRMFHAVSLETDAEAAKGLAFSVGALRDGVRRVEHAALELTAVVEPFATVSDVEQYRYGVEVMEGAGLQVLTVADLGRAAETARRELHV